MSFDNFLRVLATFTCLILLIVSISFVSNESILQHFHEFSSGTWTLSSGFPLFGVSNAKSKTSQVPNSESRNRYQIGLVWLGTFFEQDLSVFPRFLNIHDSPWPINQSLSTHKMKPCNVIILKFISRIFPIDFLPINNSGTSSVFSIFQHFIYTKYIKQYLTQEYKPFQAIRRKERGEGGIKESNFSFFFF
jgi:hypothetical protein